MGTDRCPALLRAANGGDKEAHFACRLPPDHAMPYHHDGARWWWLDDGEVHMSVGRPDGAGPCRWCDGEGDVWIPAYGRRAPCDGCNGSGSRSEGVTDDTTPDTLRGRIVQALIDRDLTEANGGRPNPGMFTRLDPYSRQMIEGNARGRADVVMAAIRPELDARDARARQHGARVAQLKDENKRLREAAARVGSAVWVSPDRHSGSACIGGTRVPAHIIAGLVPDVGPDGVARFYPDVSPVAAAAAVWFGQRYIDRADHDETEVAGARDRARQITGEGISRG